MVNRRTSLCVSLSCDEVLLIGPDIVLSTRRDGARVRVRVTAPEAVRILREKVKRRALPEPLGYCPYCGRDLVGGFCDHCQKGYA